MKRSIQVQTCELMRRRVDDILFELPDEVIASQVGQGITAFLRVPIQFGLDSAWETCKTGRSAAARLPLSAPETCWVNARPENRMTEIA